MTHVSAPCCGCSAALCGACTTRVRACRRTLAASVRGRGAVASVVCVSCVRLYLQHGLPSRHPQGLICSTPGRVAWGDCAPLLRAIVRLWRVAAWSLRGKVLGCVLGVEQYAFCAGVTVAPRASFWGCGGGRYRACCGSCIRCVGVTGEVRVVWVLGARFRQVHFDAVRAAIMARDFGPCCGGGDARFVMACEAVLQCCGVAGVHM